MSLKTLTILVILSCKFSDIFSCELRDTSSPICDHIVSAFYYQRATWTNIDILNTYNRMLVPLKKTSFNKLDSLTSLYIKNSINDIEPGTFQKLPIGNLILEENELDDLSPQSFQTNGTGFIMLKRNGITELSNHMFGESNTLTFLFIEEKIRIVPARVFRKLCNLQILDLQNNEITTIENRAFQDLSKLVLLNLRRNKLTTFDSTRLFSASGLVNLVLDHNKLTSLNRSTFRGLGLLRSLDLRHNLITSIASDTFYHQHFLDDLYLANNQLIKISATVLPEFLHELSVSFNNLTCLPENFFVKLPVLDIVSVVGNPWQCPCWANIRKVLNQRNVTQMSCSKDFFHGIYPTCVSHENPTTKCTDDERFTKEFSEIYYTELFSDSSSTLPECNDTSKKDMLTMGFRIGRQKFHVIEFKAPHKNLH